MGAYVMRLPKPTPCLARSTAVRALLIATTAICLAVSTVWSQADEGAATRLMVEAQRLEQSRGGEAALLEYEALVKRFPQSPLAPKALAASALIQFDLGDLERAELTAKMLVDSYSNSGEGASGLVMQARILVERAASVTDLNDALTLLKRVPNLFGGNRYPLLEPRAEARVFAGQLLLQLGDLGAAATSFVEAIEDEPKGRFTLAAHLGLGRVLALRGDRVSAMEAFQLAINEGLINDDPASQRAVADARRRLSLLYRFWIRPAINQTVWTTSQTLTIGSEWKKPRGVAASASGEVLVNDTAVGAYRISPDQDGAASSVAVRNAGKPFIDGKGRRYLPTQSSVRQMDPSNSTIFATAGEKPKQLEKLQAGARGILGEWYLIDKAFPGVQVFSKDGNILAPLSEDLEVVDVAIDERGRVFVLSQKPSRVTIFDLDRQSVNVISGGWSKPGALDVDWLGNIYVLDTSSNSVAVIDESGTRVTSIPASLPGVGALRAAEDIAVDGSGQVFITDSKLQTVYRLN